MSPSELRDGAIRELIAWALDEGPTRDEAEAAMVQFWESAVEAAYQRVFEAARKEAERMAIEAMKKKGFLIG